MTKQQIRNSFKTHFKDVEGYYKDEKGVKLLRYEVKKAKKDIPGHMSKKMSGLYEKMFFYKFEQKKDGKI